MLFKIFLIFHNYCFKALENIETNSELNQIPRYKLLSAKFEKMNASPNFNYSLKQQITKNERLLHLCRISSLNWSNQHKTYNISNHLKSLKNEKYFFNS